MGVHWRTQPNQSNSKPKPHQQPIAPDEHSSMNGLLVCSVDDTFEPIARLDTYYVMVASLSYSPHTTPIRLRDLWVPPYGRSMEAAQLKLPTCTWLRLSIPYNPSTKPHILGPLTVEAKKLERDCTTTPNPRKEEHPTCMFQLFGVYCTKSPKSIQVVQVRTY